MPPSPPHQPAGRHCCIGITRFNEAMRSRQVQPRCAGVHVVIQDATRPSPGRNQAESVESEEPKQQPSVTNDWRFTCYGFSEWTSNGTAGTTIPRCRFGLRPFREMSQTGLAREHVPTSTKTSQHHKAPLEPKRDEAQPLPETAQVTTKPEPAFDWERLQQRLGMVHERWVNAGHSLYTATGKTATKILDRDWARDIDRLHASMNRTGSRATTAASSAAEAVQRRLREFRSPD